MDPLVLDMTSWASILIKVFINPPICIGKENISSTNSSISSDVGLFMCIGEEHISLANLSATSDDIHYNIHRMS